MKIIRRQEQEIANVFEESVEINFQEQLAVFYGYAVEVEGAGPQRESGVLVFIPYVALDEVVAA